MSKEQASAFKKAKSWSLHTIKERESKGQKYLSGVYTLNLGEDKQNPVKLFMEVDGVMRQVEKIYLNKPSQYIESKRKYVGADVIEKIESSVKEHNIKAFVDAKLVEGEAITETTSGVDISEEF